MQTLLLSLSEAGYVAIVGSVCLLLGAGVGAVGPWRNAGLQALTAALARQDQELATARAEIAELRVEVEKCETDRAVDRAEFAAELLDLRQRLNNQ